MKTFNSKEGRTIADIILPKLNNALEYSKSGDQLFLEDNDDEK